MGIDPPVAPGTHPLDILCFGRGDLLVYQKHATTSSLDDRRVVSLADHPHPVIDPRLPDPAFGMGNPAKAGSNRVSRSMHVLIE